MFRSRAEFRRHLRIDNAHRRLTPHGRRVGLIKDESWQDFQAKQKRIEEMKSLLDRTKLTSAMLDQIQEQAAHHRGTPEIPEVGDISTPEGISNPHSISTPEGISNPHSISTPEGISNPAPKGRLTIAQRFSAGYSDHSDRVPEGRPKSAPHQQDLRAAMGQPLSQVLKRPEISIEQL